MQVRHPRALADVAGHPPSAVSVDRTEYAIEDGIVDVPDEYVADRLASAYGLSVSDIRVTETCDVVKADGEVCGRELPCPYHSEDDE